MPKCRSCKADILWVDMPTGKKMPLDAKPFKMVIVKQGIGEIVDAYIPHWATCPGAEKFRRKVVGGVGEKNL